MHKLFTFLGTHPTLTQVPPSLPSASITATLFPYDAARRPPPDPPLPPPMIM